MAKQSSFRIVSADLLSLDQFRRWHEAMISLAEARSGGDYLLPRFGFRFALRPTGLAVPDCDLTWGLDTPGRTVQINPAESAGDANVLSAIGEDREAPGNFAVLRQGRLHPNRASASQISGGEFRHAFQRMPVTTTGSFGAKGREWFLVCMLSPSVEEIVRQTADFVERCSNVRSRCSTPVPISSQR